VTADKPERVRVRYVGPTETVGSRLVVTWRGRRRSLPFDYAVRDVFTWAASQVTGYPEAVLMRANYRDPDNRTYSIDQQEEHEGTG